MQIYNLLKSSKLVICGVHNTNIKANMKTRHNTCYAPLLTRGWRINLNSIYIHNYTNILAHRTFLYHIFILGKIEQTCKVKITPTVLIINWLRFFYLDNVKFQMYYQSDQKPKYSTNQNTPQKTGTIRAQINTGDITETMITDIHAVELKKFKLIQFKKLFSNKYINEQTLGVKPITIQYIQIDNQDNQNLLIKFAVKVQFVQLLKQQDQ
eukprot:TRINITY_DN2392_c0_g2_i6.p2 TRINITY_DN2392_c0_g2~~TRINITY_DN2392_c0_g2_i6.p2  ORF type:complete len:210 (-),score=-13.66 TRINITY_DN2392_c0_g2_i6:457-1086(-)